MSYSVSDHIAWQRVGDAVVLVNLDSAVAIGLNPVGSLVFPLVEDQDENSIVAAIVGEFDVEPRQARKDLQEFFAMMLEQRVLIERSGK